ncbi:DsbA family protein [Aureimonas frigidaquae]|uniref:DsbA family protein n=1 Tax=Aureimonas frigidaquae TaxID=424757 RepID=UPI000A71C3CD|nr:DsbA family protein [Aureimonas frigidaquae]
MPISRKTVQGRLAAVMLAGAAILAAAPAFTGVALAQEAPAATRQTDASAATAPQSQGSVDTAALMAPGALPDIVIGNPDAPVTIVEYASLTCSHCADFHANAYPAIKADYLDTGVAKLVLREFPFDPRALAGFMLARCVPEDRRTAMVDVLFDQQRQWAMAENASVELLAIARQAGMSQEQFTACLQNAELQGKVMEVQKRGQDEFGVAATPTFFINGDRYAGAMTANEMAAVIEAHR